MSDIEMLKSVFGTKANIIMLLNGAKMTILLSLIGISGGTFVGLVAAVLRALGGKRLRALVAVYAHSMRRVPLLILLLLSYTGLSKYAGIRANNLTVATIGIIIYAGSYMTETIRSGIESIPEAQRLSGYALGFSKLENMRYVIFPQALRVAIPPSVSFMQSLIKDTSMAVIIGFMELARVGVILRNQEPFASFYIFLAIMILYFIICYPLQNLSQRLEKKYGALGGS